MADLEHPERRPRVSLKSGESQDAALTRHSLELVQIFLELSDDDRAAVVRYARRLHDGRQP